MEAGTFFINVSNFNSHGATSQRIDILKFMFLKEILHNLSRTEENYENLNKNDIRVGVLPNMKQDATTLN
jgi:hypothetical protein